MKSRNTLRWLFFVQAALQVEQSTVVNAELTGIPTVPFVPQAGGGSLNLLQLQSIQVDEQFADVTDQEGETLIPPTLLDFANTIRSDLSTLGINIPVRTVKPVSDSSKLNLFLTLGNNTGFVDAASRRTSEAYALNVSSSGIVITGASPLGVWWGSRTLLQQAILRGNLITMGSGIDTPGWDTRGIMLDGGRHFYPIDFLKEICAYISYFKQNTFHLHLSDNLSINSHYTPEEIQNLYAAFRLNSDAPDLKGLAKRTNETYTRAEFDDLQQSCASRGVTIIPEIEAPGHALVITQWKPELGIATDASLLNITFPETIPTMERIWQEFLPWFHSKSVHIGADEYDSSLADDYNLFVNTMSSSILQESGKDIRIWGTNEPGKNSNVSTNITIQHWDFSDDNPLFTLIDKGYRVINSDDSFYIVAGFSESFPQSLNLTRIFHGDPSVPGGGPFSPNIFDVHNATNNPLRSNPGVLGHIAAQWNDFGPNATTFLEIYYDWRGGLPALADKQWGGNLTQDAYATLLAAFQGDKGGKIVIPGQNLDRTIVTKTSTILKYDFGEEGLVRDGIGAVTTVRDRSGNGYDAKVSNATVSNGIISFTGPNSFLTTPLGSKGFNYTLSFSIRPTAPAPGQGIGAIFSSNDSILLNGLPGNGPGTPSVPFHNLTLFTAGNYYSLNYSLPNSGWTQVTLSGRDDFTTSLSVKSANSTSQKMHFLATIGINGDFKVWKDIPIVAPLTKIGGFVGQMANISLTNVA